MNTLKKIIKLPYKRVHILWHDIQESDKAWIEKNDMMSEDVAVCQDIGFIFKQTKDKLWLFTSYSFDKKDNLSFGGLTVFPMGCIKKIERID